MIDKKTAAVVLVLILGFFSLAAVVGTIDWVFGVKNKPELDVRSYVWTRTYGHGASGTLTSAGAHTATLSPCPAGISATSVGVAAFHIYNGSGGAETPVITSFTGSGANCTIGFTTVNGHTGSWVMGPNGGGIQEAAIDSGGTGALVRVPSGTYLVYAPIYVPASVTILGDGFATNIQGQSASIGLFNVESGGAVAGSVQFRDLQLSSVVQQTTGAYGVRIGNTGESVTPMFTRVYFFQLWDSILGVSMNQLHVTGCTFYEMGHAGIVAQDTAHPDNGGPRITSNVFLNYSTSGAEAAILINSSAEHMISNNTLDGGGLVKWFVEYNSTTSGGWINIANNKCETTALGCISLTGYGAGVAITGNTMANSGNVGTWDAISVNGSSGSGFLSGTITGNAITGASGSNSNRGIFFQGTTSDWTISGNTLQGLNYGINISGSPTGILIGPNSIRTIYTSTVYVASSGVVIDGGTTNYASMVSTSSGQGYAGNSSRLYCTDCSSTCTAGSSTGRTCFRENGAWTH